VLVGMLDVWDRSKVCKSGLRPRIASQCGVAGDYHVSGEDAEKETLIPGLKR
jgi:hypothetical protein